MKPHQNQDRHSLKIPGLVEENSSPGFRVFNITNYARVLSMSELHFASHCPHSSLKDLINTNSYQMANTCQSLKQVLCMHRLWAYNNPARQLLISFDIWGNWELSWVPWPVKCTLEPIFPLSSSGSNSCFFCRRMLSPDPGLSKSKQKRVLIQAACEDKEAEYYTS